ncbi:PAS domain-containing protein [Sphingomonas xanthus]|uniref:PAS domain-containing protein n=1 Tax=Sphingomonas xanthus TaxID=2594473 RepID=A0A516IP72_9SPHN|nr:PAS domain-containing protein [Sphingomonas xanthus]QDP18715.1 PAS domain-containing protein [Sphingomonas xanthus]
MAKDVAEADESEFQQLLDAIHRTPIPTVVTDKRQADNPIVAVNEAFARLTGYEVQEILGRNCRFLAGPSTDPKAQAVLRDAVDRGEPAVAELLNYRKDGSPFRNAVMVAPVRDGRGEVAMFIGSQMEVGENGRAGGLRKNRARHQVDGLTPRLRQVLSLMAAGFRNKQIGIRLGIEEKTVKMHRARLINALGVASSAEAIRIAVEADLPTSGDH